MKVSNSPHNLFNRIEISHKTTLYLSILLLTRQIEKKMGDLISKSAKTNCIKTLEYQLVPKYHFKCRFHIDDEMCSTDVYTRTKDVIVSIFQIY